jgi:hypothetical protein
VHGALAMTAEIGHRSHNAREAAAHLKSV